VHWRLPLFVACTSMGWSSRCAIEWRTIQLKPSPPCPKTKPSNLLRPSCSLCAPVRLCCRGNGSAQIKKEERKWLIIHFLLIKNGTPSTKEVHRAYGDAVAPQHTKAGARSGDRYASRGEKLLSLSAKNPNATQPTPHHRHDSAWHAERPPNTRENERRSAAT
jgi:hypothetical protein